MEPYSYYISYKSEPYRSNGVSFFYFLGFRFCFGSYFDNSSVFSLGFEIQYPDLWGVLYLLEFFSS